MRNYDEATKKKKICKHNLNGPLILDHQYKVLITVEALDLKKRTN